MKAEDKKIVAALSESSSSDLLDLRIRQHGEIMQNGDVVLYGGQIVNLGFDSEYWHYYAGEKVIAGMDGIVITRKPNILLTTDFT